MRSWLYDMECSLLTKLPAFSTQLALRHLPFIVRNARGRRRVWTSRLLGTLYRLLPLLLFPSFSFFSSFLHPLTISTSGIVMVDTTILWDALHSVSGMFVYRKRQNDSSVLILQFWFLSCDSSVVIPQFWFLSCESSVLIPQFWFLSSDSSVLIPQLWVFSSHSSAFRSQTQ